MAFRRSSRSKTRKINASDDGPSEAPSTADKRPEEDKRAYVWRQRNQAVR